MTTAGLKFRLLYITLIFIISSSSAISQVKYLDRTKAPIAKQNNPRQLANNFSYKILNGLKKQLYSIDAKYTLLFFYNPECDACKQYKEMLSTSKVINNGLKQGSLKVLAI